MTASSLIGGAPPRFSRVDRDAGDDTVDMAVDALRADLAEGRDLAFRIEYVDASGKATERSVRVMSVDARGAGGSILAWCFLRSALRKFRSDRVRLMWWLDTGEVVDDPGQLLDQLADAAPDDAAVAPLRAGLRLLAWVARADGHFDPREASAMVDFVEECAGRLLNRQALMTEFRALYPSPAAARASMAAVRRWPTDRKRELRRAIEALMSADGEHSIEEFGRAAEIRAFL
jgi:hypothetical protein